MSDTEEVITADPGNSYEGFDLNLRVPYEEEPEEIILDDCAVIDFLLDCRRRTEDNKLGYQYVEDSRDVRSLLERFDGSVKLSKSTDEFRAVLNPTDISRQEFEARIDLLDANTTHLDMEGIEPREGFRKVSGVGGKDKILAEYAYRSDAVVATYDDDFLKFPINYTTPAMLSD